MRDAKGRFVKGSKSELMELKDSINDLSREYNDRLRRLENPESVKPSSAPAWAICISLIAVGVSLFALYWSVYPLSHPR